MPKEKNETKQTNKKTWRERDMFSKSCFKKDMRKSAQMMIHGHISQYLVKNNNEHF